MLCICLCILDFLIHWFEKVRKLARLFARKQASKQARKEKECFKIYKSMMTLLSM